MKNLLTLTFVIIIVAGFSKKVLSQTNSETTDTGAKIVRAITITETEKLHFGTMAIPTGATDIKLSTATVREATISGNVVLLAQAPVATNATYTVAGASDATYLISLPGNTAVIITSGINHMHVTDFVSRASSKSVDGTSGTLNGTGGDGFKVGATLKLDNAQPYGTYSGTFDVTVDYN